MLTQKDLNKLKAGKGQIVRGNDGTLFFVPQKSLKRLTTGKRKAVGKVWGSGPAHAANCARWKRWLLSHDPNTRVWREVFVAWIENC
jgi:hypothetical protein